MSWLVHSRLFLPEGSFPHIQAVSALTTRDTLHKNISCFLRLTGHMMAAPFVKTHSIIHRTQQCPCEYERHNWNPDFYFREQDIMCTKSLFPGSHVRYLINLKTMWMSIITLVITHNCSSGEVAVFPYLHKLIASRINDISPDANSP